MFKKIKKLFNYPFSVSKDRLYSIAIEANCKSGKILGIFGGEDLRVEIDDIKFREIPAKGRTQYFNIPPAWNGTKLKRLPKTIIFILKLKKGNHVLKFIPKKGAIINKKPEIKQIKSNKILENIQSQERNRQPWITIALIDLPLKILDVSVTCKKRERDSDDVKLLIDGEIQKNKQSSWWEKNWYWQGKRLQGKTEETRFYPKLSKGIHYIEFSADRTPFLNWINMDLGIKSIKEPRKKEKLNKKTIQKYTYKGPYGKYNYNRYDTEIENIVNEWNKEFLNDKYPPKKPLDPSLVKAIIYQESKVGYYPGGEINVMQVGNLGDPSIHALNNNGVLKLPNGELALEYEIKNGKEWTLDYGGKANNNTVYESIKWGTRWLYHKAQGVKNDKRYWRTWKEAIFGYGPNTQEYVDKVWNIYTKGIDPKGNILWKADKKGFSLIKTLLSISLALFIFSASWYYVIAYTEENQKENIIKQNNSLSEEKPSFEVEKIFLKNLDEYKKGHTGIGYQAVFKEAIDKCKELNCIEAFAFFKHYDDLVKYMQSDRQFLDAASSLGLIGLEHKRDIDNDGENETVFFRIDLLNRDFVAVSIIDKINGNYKIIEKKIDWGYLGYVELFDVTGDLLPEIVLFVHPGKGGYKLLIYKYQDNKQLKKIFSNRGNDIYYAEYTFSDLDNDNNIEIKINGEIRYTPNHGKKFQEIYEYNTNDGGFILL